MTIKYKHKHQLLKPDSVVFFSKGLANNVPETEY